MYDLTSVLTTIAACSASIVAILGGLIASKLLALNAEREESETRLSEIDEEISFYKEERDKIQATLDEDDALDFIRNNIENLIQRKDIDSIYQEENWPSIEKIPYVHIGSTRLIWLSSCSRRQSAKRFTHSARRPLRESLPTPRKNTVCVIHTTEVCPGSLPG